MEAKRALQQLRPSRRTVEPSIVDRLVNMVGGRLSYISKVRPRLLLQ